MAGEDGCRVRLRGDPRRSRARRARRDGQSHRRARARSPAAAGGGARRQVDPAALLGCRGLVDRDHQGASRQPSAVHHRALDAAVEPLPRRGRAAQRPSRRRADHRQEPRAAHDPRPRAGAPRGRTRLVAHRRHGLQRARCCCARSRSAATRPTSSCKLHGDFVVNPELVRALRTHFGIELDGPALAALAHDGRRLQAAAGHRPPARADRRRSRPSPSSRVCSCRASRMSASRWRGMPPTSTTRCSTRSPATPTTARR